MRPTPGAARRNPAGLSRPRRAASNEGRPPKPPPMMVLSIRAVRVQRPIARTRWDCGVFTPVVPMTADDFRLSITAPTAQVPPSRSFGQYEHLRRALCRTSVRLLDRHEALQFLVEVLDDDDLRRRACHARVWASVGEPLRTMELPA